MVFLGVFQPEVPSREAAALPCFNKHPRVPHVRDPDGGTQPLKPLKNSDPPRKGHILRRDSWDPKQGIQGTISAIHSRCLPKASNLEGRKSSCDNPPENPPSSEFFKMTRCEMEIFEVSSRVCFEKILRKHPKSSTGSVYCFHIILFLQAMPTSWCSSHHKRQAAWR